MNLYRIIRGHPTETLQIMGAIVISMIFQFLIPLSWQPLDSYLKPTIKHGDPGTNIIILTISQWYFSFSVMWFFKRSNKFINNFLIYSIPPLFSIFILEFYAFRIYYDYIHLLPLIVAFLIFFTQLESIKPKFVIWNIILLSVWLFTTFSLRLAYYNDPLSFFAFKLGVICLVDIIIAITIRLMQKRHQMKLDNFSTTKLTKS